MPSVSRLLRAVLSGKRSSVSALLSVEHLTAVQQAKDGGPRTRQRAPPRLLTPLPCANRVADNKSNSGGDAHGIEARNVAPLARTGERWRHPCPARRLQRDYRENCRKRRLRCGGWFRLWGFGLAAWPTPC